MRIPIRNLLAGIALGAALLSGCQTADPPEAETFLNLSLHDSLAGCEKVLIQVFDRKDTTDLLGEIWNGPLPDPRQGIPSYNITRFGTAEILVQVSGYKAGGQLAVKTLIYYSPSGGQSVRHAEVPRLTPRNWLEALVPSIGAMNPAFNRDLARFSLTLPAGASSVSFIPTGAYPGAIIQAKGKTVASGQSTEVFQVGSAQDSIWFTVTDTSTGIASTREYRVILVPTLPPQLELASLVPSVGEYNHEFTPGTSVYVLYMPKDVDEVSFRGAPADPRTMTVTVDNLALFPNQQSQVFTVPKGEILIVDVVVSRGSESGVYHIIIDHVQNS